MHIRDLCRLRPILYYKTACTIATSIVHSKLDYCKSLFYGINSSHSKRMQTIQNALVRAVTKAPIHHHITPVLKSLHWQKVPQHIHYKIVSLTYNTLQTSQPSYIRQLLTIQPPGSTHSSSYLSLSRPTCLILFEVLQPLLCLRCTSSLERTPKTPPPVCSSS